MLSYPARFIPQPDGRVRLILPDVAEVAVVAAGEAEAMEAAVAELERVLESYAAAARPLPRPSDICGAPAVATQRFSLPARA